MTSKQQGPASGATYWSGWKIEGMTTHGQGVVPIPGTGGAVSGGLSWQTITLKQTATGGTASYSSGFVVASVGFSKVPGSASATRFLEAVGKFMRGFGAGYSPDSWPALGSEILGTPNLPRAPKAADFDCYMSIWTPNVAVPVAPNFVLAGGVGLVLWTGLPFLPAQPYAPFWAASVKGMALFASPGISAAPGAAVDLLHGCATLKKP